MVVIKFRVRDSIVTWFIDDNWGIFIGFALTAILSLAFKKIKRRIENSNKKIKMSNPRGGKFIDECIDPNSIYEVVDPVLQVVIKQMLNLPPGAGPVVISGPLLIIAYIASRQPIKQVTILGVNVFTDKLQSFALKTGVGILSGSIVFFTPFGVVSLTGALLAGALAFNISQ